MARRHPGSFEDAHALRDGQSWPPATDTGEEYDLIVVGGGISRLSAAHFYRAAVPGARILILDNHDDFGGHAKRNEFNLDGHLHLLNGGTLEIGAEKLVVGIGGATPLDTLLEQAPLSARARREIVQLEAAKIDHMPDVFSAEKKQRLSRMNYEAFLRDVVRVEPAVLAFYNARTKGEWGTGTDAVSALDCWSFGMPGFQGMQLERGSIARMGFTPAGYADTGGSYRLHFPEGNATIARLLVRDLIARAIPGSRAGDVVTARAASSWRATT